MNIATNSKFNGASRYRNYLLKDISKNTATENEIERITGLDGISKEEKAKMIREYLKGEK